MHIVWSGHLREYKAIDLSPNTFEIAAYKSHNYFKFRDSTRFQGLREKSISRFGWENESREQMDAKRQEQKQLAMEARQRLPAPSTVASSAISKPIAIYEILNKIQHVINSESALPQFINFARAMEEMRQKWLATERKCAEYEKRYQDAIMEKKILQNQLTELK